MPNKSLVIVIAGHGSCSSKGALIDYGKYHVLCATKKGFSFDITSYNFLMGMLLSATDAAALRKSVETIETFPSTVIVDHSNKKHIDLGKRAIDLSDIKQRQELLAHIKSIGEESQNSSISWELLDHKLAPADEIFNHECCLKLHARKGYSGFDVMHPDFLEAMKKNDVGITINLSFDIAYLCKHAEELFEQHKSDKEIPARIPEDQILHIKPVVVNESGSEHILLSQVLGSLSNLHVIVRIEEVDSGAVDSEIFQVILEDFAQHPDYKAAFAKADGDKVHLIDYSVPENSNIIFGACREVDSDF